jgi:ribosomal protein L21E
VFNNDWFVDGYLNQLVISRSPSHYGYVGKVVDIQKDSNYLHIDYGKKGKVLEDLGTLEFVDL